MFIKANHADKSFNVNLLLKFPNVCLWIYIHLYMREIFTVNVVGRQSKRQINVPFGGGMI